MKKIAVVGSGPSGLMCIYSLIERGYKNITLFESDNQIGKRIKVSGNGRCNFFHNPIDYNKYSDGDIAKEYMALFLENKDTIFEDLGLLHFIDEEGRMYPRSESGKTVVNLFSRFLKNNNIKVQLETKIIRIEEFNNKVKLYYNNQFDIFDAVVLAIGGFSYLYDVDDKLKFLNSSNIDITSITPALVPIKTEKYKNKLLEGKRFKVNLALLKENKLIYEEKGELLFKKDGISGIVTFNISSYLARLHLSSYKGYRVVIDFAPDLSREELSSHLFNSKFSLEEALENLFIKELKDELIQHNKKDIIKNIKNYALEVIDLYPFKFSQVTSGGIDITSIDENKALIKLNNVYPCGEILNIDGLCGGYNIAFAFASGYKIGKLIK